MSKSEFLIFFFFFYDTDQRSTWNQAARGLKRATIALAPYSGT